MKESIDTLRKKIDSLDVQLLKLLDERASLAKSIGKLKRTLKLPVTCEKREREIYEKLRAAKLKNIDNESLANIYSEIISACKKGEEPPSVAFLGPQGTFSHICAKKFFGSSVSFLPFVSIEDVFKSVESGIADYGVVPIENSVEGSVNSTLDMLSTSSLRIRGEKKLPVQHNLLAKDGVKLEDIRIILSHPQALAQCRNYLARNLPRAERKETASTAHACELLNSTSAAIASELAARIFKLNILRRRIQDNSDCSTRFVLISKSDAEPSGKDKTSLMFSVRHKPGTLFSILRIFSENSINLTKIESRPSKQRPWEYNFFVDFDGHKKDKKCAKALKEVEKHTTFFKILGSYPAD
ncbi:MAG: prephenate dehydratase [Candidatus Micrarchaeota archaeon]